MKGLVINLFFLTITVSAAANQDTIPATRKSNLESTRLSQPTLTPAQQQWLDNNYTKLNGMTKTNASMVIKQQFNTISEASIDYMIGLAGKLVNKDHQQQLAQMKQMLNQLKSQKNALLNQIKNKEAQYSSSGDDLKRARLNNEIALLKTQLRIVETQIATKEEAIRKQGNN